MQQGAALCRGCGVLLSLAEVMEQQALEAVLTSPPWGCRIDDSAGVFEVRVAVHSVGRAAGAIIASVFWNGITGVFVMIAIGATWQNLIGALPSWFPAPANLNMPLGGVLFLWLFLTPFISIGLLLIWTALLSMMGTLVVTINGQEGRVFTGVGWVGWTRRFDASAVRSVKLGETSYQENGRTKSVIVIDANRKVKFGTVMEDEQRRWTIAVLAARLVKV